MAQINHFLHEDPLVLTEEAEEEINDEEVCCGCLNRLAGPVYGCTDCKFYLHKSCTEALVSAIAVKGVTSVCMLNVPNDPP
ncbi:hypothetical protein DITRI_Ditri17bG0121000 [Diplodiscus trichospermus]